MACALAVMSLAVGCSPASEEPTPDSDSADDFLSDSAREFLIEGRAFITVEEDVAESNKMKRAMELIKLKHIVLAYFINDFMMESDEKEMGFIIGIGAMVKTGSIDELSIKQINDRSFEFTFKHIIAGRRDVLQILEVKDGGEFEVEIGKPTNEEMAELTINEEWYSKEPWKIWVPEKQPQDKKETIFLTVTRQVPTADAWWDFNRLVEDGILTIDAHFGWDFHDALHLKQSEDLYNWLTKEKGFESPVDEFAQINRRSRPLTRTIEMNGKDVEVQVKIFYGRDDTVVDPDTDEGGKNLEEDLRTSLNEADIIAFSGHSGPFFGFPLANWNETDEGDFDDSEMPKAKMPADKYQVVFGEGCDTIMIGPAFLSNVNKKGKNIDIVTTTNVSDAVSQPIVNFLTRLLEVDSQGRHRPKTIRNLLSELDPAALYGVHGAADNPQLHPYAVRENFCKTCSTHADCGGAGNACMSFDGIGKRCTAACTIDSACGKGFTCRVFESGSGSAFGKLCQPNKSTCK